VLAGALAYVFTEDYSLEDQQNAVGERATQTISRDGPDMREETGRPMGPNCGETPRTTTEHGIEKE